MKVFLHINELRGGWTSFPYLSLFAEQIALWSPSAHILEKEFNKDRSIFNRKTLLDLIDQGLVTVQGREQWFDKTSRNRYADVSLRWDDLFDSELRRLAKADEHEPTKRVSIAPKGLGEEFAKKEFEEKTHRFKVAHQLVTKKRIPYNVRRNIKSQGLTHIDDKAKLLMQVFKNHEDALHSTGSTITCEEEGFPMAEYAKIVDRPGFEWGDSTSRLTEQKVRDFIDLAKDIGRIDTKDKFLRVMLDKKVKDEVNAFLALEAVSRDELITQMKNGIVGNGILSDLITKNPVLNSFTLVGLVAGGSALASEVVKEDINKRNLILGAVAMAFTPVATMVYRASEALSLAPLSEDRYVGPRWPVLLALGKSSITLIALRELIEDLKTRLQ